MLQTPDRPHLAANHGYREACLEALLRSPIRWHRARLPLTDLDVVLQVLHCASVLEALVVLCSVVRFGQVRVPQVREQLTGRNHTKARQVLARLDVHSESALEVVSRFHLEEASYQVASQVYIPGLGRADQLVDGVLAIELMGKAYHLSSEAFTEDLRRFNQYTVSGIPVLRVGYALVVHHPMEFIALVHRALQHTRPPGPASWAREPGSGGRSRRNAP
ncbi:hypothetical protein [Psychromicrobium xiongbiense]|uniref:hypothetical protein n=1 Tax=Psychromicrobium xiongbiense TaxID=3051184 RepID=UPI0025553158|nr:hypothetical protein [Psychromicrobium sp. YIM S02556]